VRNADPNEDISGLVRRISKPGDGVYVCAPRGVDQTRWTQKNPPNYVERSHVLLGRTVDTGRVWDIIAVARHLHGTNTLVYVAGEGPAAVLAAYAALWEPDIAGVIAVNPPTSHMEANAPQFLNILRVCDIPDVFGMLVPRSLTVYGWSGEAMKRVSQAYVSATATKELRFVHEGENPE